MQKFNNLEDLFNHQLKDLYSAETQLIEALPKMKENASNDSLKDAISKHVEETKNHKKRIKEIGEDSGIDVGGVTCEAMKGLVNEAQSFISEDAEDSVKDAGIIADAQRVEHYEISAYGTAIQFAKSLNHDNAVDKLEQTLKEEENADSMLNKIAESSVNEQAKKAEAL